VKRDVKVVDPNGGEQLKTERDAVNSLFYEWP